MGELFRPGTHAGSTDIANKNQRTRVWLVAAPPPAALTFDPLLPQLGSPYPYGNPNAPFPLTLDRYDVEPFEDGNQSIVTLVYTNDRSGRLRPVPDQTRPNYQEWSIDIQKSTQEIPSVLVFPQPVPGANVLETETPDAEPKVYKVAHTYGVYEVTVPLQSMTTATVDAIRAQTDHIHLIGQHYYRFEPGKINHVEPNVWLATYSWIGDDGCLDLTGIPFQGSGPTNARWFFVGPAADNRVWYFPEITQNMLPPGPGPNPPALPDMVRSPFHVLTYALRKDMLPEFSQFCPFVLDDLLGWRSLPGDLNL